MRGLLSIILLGAVHILHAQEKPFEGFWSGYLTQGEGGFRPKYHFEITLEQHGQTVKGLALSSVDKLYAEMTIDGTVTGTLLKFQEHTLVRYTRIEEMSWCLKKGELKLIQRGKNWVLEGNWEGKSPYGVCIPGKIHLTKKAPRA